MVPIIEKNSKKTSLFETLSYIQRRLFDPYPSYDSQSPHMLLNPFSYTHQLGTSIKTFWKFPMEGNQGQGAPTQFEIGQS